MIEQPTYKPQGAFLQPDGSVVWRVWAPRSENVTLVTRPDGHRDETAMTAEGFGFFTCAKTDVRDGLRYAYRLEDGREYPDPATRRQPDGVHLPSALWFPNDYAWHDADWRGMQRDELVIYELHVGTFTPEGTFAAVIPRLAQLVELGITAIELMPVAQFSGERNWGYDGVHPFAVQNSYGGPRALQQLIDAAHQAGLAVLIDVVYNHFGPEGNYLGLFGPYETDRYRTPWGKAVNFDGPESDPVRRFVIDNAVAWVRDFHADGLRLDAVHTIYDFSARHILAEMQAEVRAEAERTGRVVHVIAESDLNDVRLVLPQNCPTEHTVGGDSSRRLRMDVSGKSATGVASYNSTYDDGLDGAWSDDFHHCVHALLTGEREGYYRDFGLPEQLAKAYNDVYVYDGCYSPFRRRRHGNRVGDTDRTRFVVAVQNHDQVGNRAFGERLTSLLPPEAQRLACGLLMISPCVPLIWMGEEYGETRPFPFFSSFSDPGLIEAVRRGRREEFAALEFKWVKDIPDPQSAETFLSAKLQWDRTSVEAAGRRRLYADLLAARRDWPALRDRSNTSANVVRVSKSSTFESNSRRLTASGEESCKQDKNRRQFASGYCSLLRIHRGVAPEIIAYANLGSEPATLPDDVSDCELLLSTESKRYGGRREPDAPLGELLPYEMMLFGPKG